MLYTVFLTVWTVLGISLLLAAILSIVVLFAIKASVERIEVTLKDQIERVGDRVEQITHWGGMAKLIFSLIQRRRR